MDKERQENIAPELNINDEQDMNKVIIIDGSQMLTSSLTKQDGEKKEIGPIVVGADKQQNVIEVSVIKGIYATNNEEIAK